MGEQTYEREIDLAKVFYRILRDWRKIFVIGSYGNRGIGLVVGRRGYFISAGS